MPFTHWSLRKLSTYLRGGYRRTAPVPAQPVTVSRERLRQILHTHRITFQHTRTWKESTDPDREAKLDRIEDVTTRFPDRCFAFDQFGPLSIRPCHGTCWAYRKDPNRIPATTTAPMGSATSTDATTWPATSCGASCTNTRAASTPWPR